MALKLSAEELMRHTESLNRKYLESSKLKYSSSSSSSSSSNLSAQNLWYDDWKLTCWSKVHRGASWCELGTDTLLASTSFEWRDGCFQPELLICRAYLFDIQSVLQVLSVQLYLQVLTGHWIKLVALKEIFVKVKQKFISLRFKTAYTYLENG